MIQSVALRSCAAWISWAWLAVLAVLGWTTPTALAQFGTEKVEVTTEQSRVQVRPGDQVVIAVIFDHEEGWHSHTHDPKPPKEWDLEAFKTDVKPTQAQGLRFGPVQWPEAHTLQLDLSGMGKPVPYEVYEGRAIAYVPVIVEDTASGEIAVELQISYQACDDSTCDMPRDIVRTVSLKVVGADAAVESAAPDAGIFGDFRTQVFSDMLAGKTVAEDLSFDFFGITAFTLKGTSPLFVVLLLLAAALGGLILNLTPCVIPVIPIKIMSLSAAAGNPRRCFYLGIVTSLGIIAFWLVIGICIASIASFKQVNQLFQNPYFTIGVGLFVAVMAVGMMGWFTVGLPQWVYRLMPAANPKSADGAAGGSTWGTFLFGVFTAVLSTPCTAPFMATASAWAAKQPPMLTLATFTAIGAGMALPYAILSAFPRWVARVPRSGPASHLVKLVMGILMLGVAIFFLGTGIDPLVRLPIDPAFRAFWWAVALCIVIAGLLLAVRTFGITRSAGKRMAWSVVGLGLACGGVWMAIHFTDRGPIPWVAYTPERFEEAKKQNKVIVMDFTAEWCLNCKALEIAVLHRKEIVEILKSADVIPMKVDLTGNNAAGQDKLKSLQWVGIPLLAISGPGAPEPIKYDTYTPQTVADAIARARGVVQTSSVSAGGER